MKSKKMAIASARTLVLAFLGLGLFSCQTLHSSSTRSKIDLDLQVIEPGYIYKFQEKILAYPDTKLFFSETVQKSEDNITIEHYDAKGNLLNLERHEIVDGVVQANGIITVYRDFKEYQTIKLVFENGRASYIEKVESQKIDSLLNSYSVGRVTNAYYELSSELVFNYKDGTSQTQVSKIRYFFFRKIGDISTETYSPKGDLISRSYLVGKEKTE